MADIPLTSFAGRLGTGLGNVLGGLAQGYAEHKLGQLEQKQQNDLLNQRAEDLKQFMPGASQEQLRALARLGEDWQKQVLSGGFGQPEQQQPQFQQPGQPQMPQMLMSQPQMQQQQFEPLKALQQLTPQAQQQVEMLPPYFQQEMLRRLGQEDKEKELAQRGMQAPQQMAPQAQPAPQGAPQQQVPVQQPPVSLGEAFRKGGTKATPKGAEKLGPAEKEFVVQTEKQAITASKVVPLLNEIEDYLDKHEDKIDYGLIAQYWPLANQNTETQEMYRKFQKLLAEMTKADTQGRGSDLMRRITSEGKLSLGQNPDTWREAIDSMREEQNRNEYTSEVLKDVRTANGGNYPNDVGESVREIVSSDWSSFMALPEQEKLEFLLSNPNKMRHVRELSDETGKLIYKRSRSGEWVPA